MKKFLVCFMVVSMVAGVSVCVAGDVNLVGEWQGPLTLHSEHSGFVSRDAAGGRIIIEEFRDGAFFGKKVWTRNGLDRVESFSGVVSPDGSTLYIAGHDDGYFFGEVLGPDEIVLYYLEDGGNAKATRRHLKRKK